MKLTLQEIRETAASKDEIEKLLVEFKSQLQSARVAKVTNGSASKVNKIREVRKAIARIKTVITQTRIAAVREALKGKKYLPKDLREKKTRAIRRRLTRDETHVKSVAQANGVAKKMVPRLTLREAKKVANRKARPFAVHAA